MINAGSINACTDKTLFTEVTLSKFLPASLHTLRRWRSEGRGPRYLKVGGTLVRYKPEDVEEFLNSSPAGGAGHRVQSR